MPFSEFVRRVDDIAYKEYIKESYFEKNGEPERIQKDAKVVKRIQKKEYKPAKPIALVGCPSIATLGEDHPARRYIAGRKIPQKYWDELFWADDFSSLVSKIAPDKKVRKEGRIIIPFLDRDRNLLAIQGRSLESGDDVIRYITIKADENAPKIYGLHRLAKTWQRIYITEGPFDSLFLPNCVAMGGGDIPPEFPQEHTIVVYDNEPRKPETIEKMNKAIDQGYRVCIWPDEITLKDINLMILEGYTEAKIRKIIDTNSFGGMQAKIKLQHWSNPHGIAKRKKEWQTNF